MLNTSARGVNYNRDPSTPTSSWSSYSFARAVRMREGVTIHTFQGVGTRRHELNGSLMALAEVFLMWNRTT
jgi:hypothetical protein